MLNTWREYVRRERNAVNVIGAIARRTLRIEVFQRIRLAARENYLDKDAVRRLTNFFHMFKHAVLKKTFSRYRQNSYELCVKAKIAAKLRLELTQVQHQQERDRIQVTKHNRAIHILNQKKMRQVNLALKEMTKFLKALRIKQQVFADNMAYLNGKKAAQKWFLRTQLTLMLRRRNEQVTKAYRLAWLKKCWDAIRRVNNLQKRGIQKFKQIYERMSFFDQAASFQKWQQYTISEGEKEKRSKKHGTQSLALILDRLVKRREAFVLHQLRNRTQKKDFKEKFMRRMLMHVRTYRLRHFFQKWHHQKECYNIADTVNVSASFQYFCCVD